MDYARTRHNYNLDLNLNHVAEGFRADLGYLPQVGYDQAAFSGEYDFYAPDQGSWQNGGFGVISNVTRATDGGPDLDRKVRFYTFVHAHYQTHIVLYATREEQYYQGKTFTLDQYEMDASAQPTDWLNAEVDVVGGDGVDYSGVRKAGLLNIDTSLEVAPGRHLKIDVVDDYEQLALSGRPLFTANVYDLRVAWYFTAHLFVDAIGQGQNVSKDTALYPPGTSRHSGSLATQWLAGYQINPWTVFYAGSSEGYQETADNQLVPRQRTFFLKGSYYFQP